MRLQTGIFAVHRDTHAGGLQRLGEDNRGELATLVAVEDLWLAVAIQRFLERVDAEFGLHGFDSRQAGTFRLHQSMMAMR